MYEIERETKMFKLQTDLWLPINKDQRFTFRLYVRLMRQTHFHPEPLYQIVKTFVHLLLYILSFRFFFAFIEVIKVNCYDRVCEKENNNKPTSLLRVQMVFFSASYASHSSRTFVHCNWNNLKLIKVFDENGKTLFVLIYPYTQTLYNIARDTSGILGLGLFLKLKLTLATYLYKGVP